MDIRDLIKIDPQDIRLGAPTRQDIYSADGQLFLGRFATVYRLETVERLQEEGYKLKPDGKQAGANRTQAQVFSRIGDIADKLVEFERVLAAGQSVGSFTLKFQTLAKAVIQCCKDDPDAALAQSYLDYHHPYSVLHHILVAVVVCVISPDLGWNEAERVSLVAAALTHDLGTLAMRHELASTEKLDEAKLQFVHAHPEAGVHILMEMGVTDPLWLEVIRDHHEHLDGSGYPKGIKVDPYSAASMMSVADGFAAMMRPRPYRNRVLGAAILADLYRYVGTRYVLAPIETISRYIGSYHAGSIVRLANGEMAVVTRHRPEQPETPELLLIAAEGDQPMDKPYAIDSSAPEYAITAALQPEVSLRFRSMVNKSWGGDLHGQ